MNQAAGLFLVRSNISLIDKTTCGSRVKQPFFCNFL